jgi:hypothetical protein
MADGEEDFSSLPLPDRFTHKVRRRPVYPAILHAMSTKLTRRLTELESQEGRL